LKNKLRKDMGLPPLEETEESKAAKIEMKKRQDRDLLKNACAILVHEIGHMFAIHHCIHFECTMNGVMSS
jgi:predicted Zn-dependent protease